MKVFRKLILLAVGISFMGFYSCTPLKKQIYLQDFTGIGDTLNITPIQHKLQPGDQLYVRILGLDEKTYGMFNTTQGNNTQTLASESSIFISSFSINDSGYIYLPYIGKINLRNLTIDESRNRIQSELNNYIKNSTVIVKHVNFKITVLGEVNNPRSFINYNKQINLFDAIGMAGDLNSNANKKDIKIIRNTDNLSTIHSIDITKRDFTQTEYFYLKPNDIVYVKPVRAKNYGTNPFPITTILSIITTAILTINFIAKN